MSRAVKKESNKNKESQSFPPHTLNEYSCEKQILKILFFFLELLWLNFFSFLTRFIARHFIKNKKKTKSTTSLQSLQVVIVLLSSDSREKITEIYYLQK